MEEISEPREERARQVWKSVAVSGKPRPIPAIVYEKEPRLVTGDLELDRVLGGGIVPGSLILIGGEPGIGKSTLMLQVAMALKNHRVLYVSGEESESQIKLRAERMPGTGENCFVLAETFTDSIFRHAEDLQPHLMIIDSVQTLQSPLLESSPGSIAQVRQSASELMKYAKETGIPVFLIGHITKDGSIAGPKTLEHMVDTVIQFEGDRHTTYRILRTSKNRFGNTSELGIYEMQSSGLRQVNNPSELLIPQREGPVSGVVIGSVLEGNRPLKIEIQSLVSVATYGTPQRTSNGNVAGGIRVEDPAIDLAVAVSLYSSYEDIPVAMDTCFVGEVGLGGEIRAVNRIEARINEAAKLGFKRIYLSRYNLKDGVERNTQGLEIRAVASLGDLCTLIESND